MTPCGTLESVVSDRELLGRWAAGDKDAGEELVQRHHAAVFRFFRAKVAAEIDDLVQQTFLALLESAGRFRGESSFATYLFGTARNVLLHHWRRHRRKEGKLDFTTRSAVDLGASPSMVLAEKGDRRLLLESLRRIPVDDQIVIELYHWEELSAADLGEILGLTEAAVRSRLHRAKARMTKVMATLADSPGTLTSTRTDLDHWAARVRELLGPRIDPAG